MKRMKKLLATVLALAMVLGLGVTAYADEGVLTLDVPASVVIDEEYEEVAYSFTPTKDGVYRFYSQGDVDARGVLYLGDPVDGEYLAYDDDGFENQNFQIYYKLDAGKTYYLLASCYSNALGEYTVTVSEAVAATGMELSLEGEEPVVGNYGYLDAVALPDNAYLGDVTWSTSDADIVRVEGCDLLYVGKGTATITATSESGITESIDITVDDFEPVELQLNEATDIELGGTVAKLWYSFTPQTSGIYLIRSVTDSAGTDWSLVVYDSKMNEVGYADNASDTLDFRGVFELEAGETYYLRVATIITEENEEGTIIVEKPAEPFTDLEKDKYYYLPVIWAVNNGITTGKTTTTFEPDTTCTRAEAVTFLWRMAGKPVWDWAENPFVDVAEDAWYYDAVMWAYEWGITIGTSETAFSPDKECTRAEIVTLLWRVAGELEMDWEENPFVDVTEDAWYYDAVMWASNWGITNGTTDHTFSPDQECTRGMIVTLLHRFLQ